MAKKLVIEGYYTGSVPYRKSKAISISYAPNCSAPVIYLVKPAWVSQAQFDYLVASIRLSIPFNFDRMTVKDNG